MPEHATVDNLLLRLRWLGRLRWLAAGGLAALALFVHFVLGLSLAWGALLILAAAIAAYNVLFLALLRHFEATRREALTFEQLELLANIQIGLDLVLLTLSLHYSGGVENPFIMIYLLHPIIASILLTPRSAYLQGAWATLLLVGMALTEAVCPSLHHSIGGYLPVAVFRAPFVIAGEVGALAVSVHTSIYLGRTIVMRLHQRERQLREAQDELEARSAELARANRELTALEERKSRFLNLAAHQLRGPLAATDGCLSAVAEGYAVDPAKQKELIGRARARIQGMLQIVRDLLTLARAHELARPSHQVRVALDEVAARVVDHYADFAASRRVELVLCSGSHGAQVLDNEGALADVVGNMVSNAIKYTREGGHVKVATRLAGIEAICEVIDDGMGIPEAEKEQVFQEFFRAKNARVSGQEGTGLGLAIVKEIIERYGGRVAIESLENLGTCAMFALPVAPAEPERRSVGA